MNEDIVKVLADKTDEELLFIIDSHQEFQDVIVLFVCMELDKRRILDPKYFSLRDSLVQKFYKQPRITESRNRQESWLAFLKPNKAFAITQIILALNVLMYIIMLISGVHFLNPSSEDLAYWGATKPSLSLTTQPWRLFTHMFLHAGFIHLFFNMYALVFVGTFLESLLGKFRYILLYIFTGIFAALFSAFFKIPGREYITGVGASGAIFGLIGFFVVFLLLDRKVVQKDSRNQMLRSMMFFLVLNIGLIGMIPSIDNSAHIGGLLYGILAGLLFFFVSIKTKLWNIIFLAISLAVSSGFFLYLNQKVQSYVPLEQIQNKEKEAYRSFNELQSLWQKEGIIKEKKGYYKEQLNAIKDKWVDIRNYFNKNQNQDINQEAIILYKQYINFWVEQLENLIQTTDNLKEFKRLIFKFKVDYQKWAEKLKATI